MFRCASRAIACVAGLSLPAAAAALPILSVDTNPSLAGVQATRTVARGDSFEVAIWIEAVDAANPLHAFELVLTHGATIAVSSVALGNFLGIEALVVHDEILPGAAELAATRVGPLGSDGAGVLVRADFAAIELGTSALALEAVLLSEPFGVPLAVAALHGAQIHVVPESATASFLVGGLVALVASRHAMR